MDTPSLTGNQAAMAAGSETLSGLRSLTAYSTEASNDINGIYEAILGRAVDTSSLTGNQAAMAAGSETLSGLRSLTAYSTEASNDIQSTFTQLVGTTTDATTLGNAEATLSQPSGGIAEACGAIISSSAVQEGITACYEDYYLGAPTTTQLTNDTAQLTSELKQQTGLTWQNLAFQISGDFYSLLDAIDPISAAQAGTLPYVSTAQQAANLAIAQKALAMPNEVAFADMVSYAEGSGQLAGYYTINNGTGVGAQVSAATLQAGFPDPNRIATASGEY